MPTRAETNACSACARSKRKCGRQVPSCAQCAGRGRSCVYPLSRSKAASSSRPLQSHALRGSVSRMGNGLLAEVAGNTLSYADGFTLDLTSPLLDNESTAPWSLIQTSSALATRVEWFLAPETWRIWHRVDATADMPVGKTTIKKHVAALQSWCERWITTGSNPLIHPCLYTENTPACVQVAYSALASYIHRTPANTDTVLQIVEDRSNDLLRENGAVLGRVAAEEWVDGEEGDVDLFAHLSRLHALMAYQIIGLFDGDIRSRHVAEGHMAVQSSWAGKLLRSATKALSNSNTAAAHLIGCLPTPSTYSQQHWYLWILSESIRRIYLIAVSLGPIFSALQQRWSPCPGGIMYTNRSGLWTAASATEWEKQCLEKDGPMLQRFECTNVLDHARPADIDDFGTTMLNISLNEELLEKWRDGSGVL